MTQTKSPKRALFLVQCLCALLGLVASLYLLVQHTRLKAGLQDSASFCSFGQYANCDVVASSRYAEVFGIPLATIGAIFFFLLLVMGILAPPKDRAFARVQRWMADLTGLALTIDLVLLIIQLVDLKTVCLVCLFTYLMVAGHLILGLLLHDQRGKLPPKEFLKQAFLTSGNLAPLPSRPALALGGFSLVTFIIVVFLLPGFIRQRSQTYSMVDNALAQFYLQWKDLPIKKLDVKEGDGTFGNPAAKVRIVTFSDFECPFCRKAAFTLHTALDPLKDRVQFVFKHYPLDSTCNPALSYQLHPHACQLARLAYCARQKNKFWEFHDKVFFTLSESQVKEGMGTIGPAISDILSADEIAACLKDEKSLANLTEDIKLGTSLSIKGTPSTFINGKAVTIPVTVETLKRLVEIESSL